MNLNDMDTLADLLSEALRVRADCLRLENENMKLTQENIALSRRADLLEDQLRTVQAERHAPWDHDGILD